MLSRVYLCSGRRVFNFQNVFIYISDLWTCDDGEKQCTGGQCLPDFYFCDGKSDCNDHSDELQCNSNTLNFFLFLVFILRLVCCSSPHFSIVAQLFQILVIFFIHVFHYLGGSCILPWIFFVQCSLRHRLHIKLPELIPQLMYFYQSINCRYL